MPRCGMCGWYFTDDAEKTHCLECKDFINKIDNKIVKNELTEYLESLGLRKFHDTTVPEICKKINDVSDKSISSELAVSVINHYLLSQEFGQNVYELFQIMTFGDQPLITYISTNHRVLYFRYLMNDHISGNEVHKFCKNLVESINNKGNRDETVFDQTVEVVEEVRKRIIQSDDDPEYYINILTNLMSLQDERYNQFIFGHLFSPPDSRLELNEQIKLLEILFCTNKFQDFNKIIVNHIIESINGSGARLEVDNFYPYRILISDEISKICEEMLPGKIHLTMKNYLVLLMLNFGNTQNQGLIYDLFKKYPNEIIYMDFLISVNAKKYVVDIIVQHLSLRENKLRRDLQRLFARRNRDAVISHLETRINEYVRENHIDLKYLLEYYVGICNIYHESSQIDFLDALENSTNNKRIIKLVSKSKRYIDAVQYSPQNFLMSKDEGKSGFGSIYDKWRG